MARIVQKVRATEWKWEGTSAIGHEACLLHGEKASISMPTEIDHIDKISTAVDHCVQVRVYK